MSQVFVRSDELKALIFDAKLQINEWKVLFAVDGVKDPEAIAGFLELSESDVSATLEKLVNMRFVLAPGANGDMASEAAVAADSSLEFEIAEPEEVAAAEAEVAAEPEVEIETPSDADMDFNLDEMLADTEETSIETMSEEEVEEDLDQLIGNLLDDELANATAEDDTATDLLGSLDDTVVEEAPAVEDEFDLGSIFQDDSNDVGFEEMVAETPVEADLTPETPAAPAAAGAIPTVLVVDDSVVIRKMVEIALENENYNIVSVATGKEALNYLDERDPDIIILDIMLSDVNGLDVLKAIKASKQIPVVMLSAKDTPRETSKAKQLGADDFIPKPFKDEELVGKIKELIRQ